VGRILCFNLIPFTFFIRDATAHARGQGLLIVEALRSHSGSSHSVGLLWTSDRPDTKTSTRQHTTIPKDRSPFPPARIRTHSNSKLAAADSRLRPRCYWDLFFFTYFYSFTFKPFTLPYTAPPPACESEISMTLS